jgi:hypothetical protein
MPQDLNPIFRIMDLLPEEAELPPLEIKCTTLFTQLAIQANIQPDLP